MDNGNIALYNIIIKVHKEIGIGPIGILYGDIIQVIQVSREIVIKFFVMWFFIDDFNFINSNEICNFILIYIMRIFLK